MRLVEIGSLVLGLVLLCAPAAALAQDTPAAPPVMPEAAHTAAGTELQQQAPEAIDAALGTVFTYQGSLTNGGQPASGAYDFRFRLFDAASNGTQVGADVTLNDAAVSAGIFTAQLGFGDVFNNTQLYLEIAVRPGADNGAYTVLAPRQRLTAAPYANYARKAPWSGILGVPAGFADNVDNDTQYGAGNGLVLANGVFAVNTGVIQQRVAATCTAGSSIRAIGADGSVTCEVDDSGLTADLWRLNGNAGTNPATQFLGTSDNVALELRVNNARAMRIEPTVSGGTPDAPNLIAGHAGNAVDPGVKGATIAGGGSLLSNNRVMKNLGVVSGGAGNLAGGNWATVSGGLRNTATEQATTVSGGSDNDAVASATTIGGGSGNLASGSFATVGGGGSNTASGSGATIGGGSGNVASWDAGTIAGGSDNQAGFRHVSIGGGMGNQATGEFSTIPGGRQANAQRFGQLAYASGMFTNPGDAQASVYVLRNRTTNAGTTELFLDGVLRRLVVEPGRAMTFDAMIVARREGANQVASYHFDGVISNFNGIMVLAKTGGAILELDPTWNANIQTNNTDDALQIVVNGPVSGAVRWVATVQTAEVVAP